MFRRSRSAVSRDAEFFGAGLCGLFGGGGFAARTPPEGMEFVARKGYTAMFFNPQTAEFVLEDMRSGERYYSMSPDPAGTLQERSQLILADLDLDGGNIRTKYSANAVVSTRKRCHSAAE